jgi:hypothetical protein
MIFDIVTYENTTLEYNYIKLSCAIWRILTTFMYRHPLASPFAQQLELPELDY